MFRLILIDPSLDLLKTTEPGGGIHANIQEINAKIVGREQRWTQRKYIEGKESLWEKNKEIAPLNKL